MLLPCAASVQGEFLPCTEQNRSILFLLIIVLSLNSAPPAELTHLPAPAALHAEPPQACSQQQQQQLAPGSLRLSHPGLQPQHLHLPQAVMGSPGH